MALTKIDDRGLKTPIDLLDDEKIRLGTGNDIEFYHDGSNNFIKATNGNTSIIANQTNINNAADTENCATFISDGAVNLFHNGTKKFETTASGITVTGGVTASAASTFNEDVVFTGTTSGRDVVFDTSLNQMRAADNAKFTAGSSADLEVYHNGSNSFIDNYTGALYIRNNVSTDNGGNIVIQAKVNEDGIIVHDDGAVEIYHDNSKTAYTHGSGFNIKGGNTSDQTELQIFGNEGQDASILLTSDDGDDNADNWRMYAQASDHSFALKNYAGGAYENSIVAHGNGAVELYYDNAKKLETWAGGIKLNGVENAGSQLMIGANSDLAFEHDGSNSYIANSTGDLVLQNDAAVKITAKAGGTQRFRFDTDGLKFGTDTAAANALDDYEEGTWTPTMHDGNGSNVVLTSTSGNCFYTKVGRLVNITGQVTRDETGSKSGRLELTSLPFTSINTDQLHCGSWWMDRGVDNDTAGGGVYMLSNSTKLRFVHPTAVHTTNSGNDKFRSATRYLEFSQWPNGRHIYFNLTYMAA